MLSLPGILGSSLIAASLLMPLEISLQAPCQKGPLSSLPLEVVFLAFCLDLCLLLSQFPQSLFSKPKTQEPWPRPPGQHPAHISPQRQLDVPLVCTSIH